LRRDINHLQKEQKKKLQRKDGTHRIKLGTENAAGSLVKTKHIVLKIAV
jgi:hypothetical protein